MTCRLALALLLAGCASAAPDGAGGCPAASSSSSSSGAPACGVHKPAACLPACGAVFTAPGTEVTPYGCTSGTIAQRCATEHGDLASRCVPPLVLGDACCEDWWCDSGHCSAQAAPGTCVPPVADAGCFPMCAPDSGV